MRAAEARADSSHLRNRSMARDQNTFAKRRREMEKKRKAEDKRARRRKKKEEANAPADTTLAESTEETPEDSPEEPL